MMCRDVLERSQDKDWTYDLLPGVMLQLKGTEISEGKGGEKKWEISLTEKCTSFACRP